MTRILFVDDEPRVLDGLRQSLRAKRKVWQMVFAEGAQKALAAMREGTFDIIVSDMRMPGMDGAELLLRAASLQPQAARVVLSGQMDESATSRAAAVAHRFLSKPCAPEALEATIRSTLELQALLASDHVRRYIGGTATLPSLPEACAALTRALADERASVDAVADIVASDVAMASKVLQLVNSSFFGLPRNVASVAQAVGYLGLNTLRNLVFAQAMFQAFSGTELEDFEGAQASALLAARIARQLLPDKHDGESAATAALLHDVGLLALANRIPKEHRENRRQANLRGVRLHEVERERLGTTHAEVGAYLLGLWGLPHDVIAAVVQHHADWSAISTLDVNAAVRIATAISDSFLRNAEPAGSADDSPPLALLEKLGLVELVQRLRAEIASSLSSQSAQRS